MSDYSPGPWKVYPAPSRYPENDAYWVSAYGPQIEDGWKDESGNGPMYAIALCKDELHEGTALGNAELIAKVPVMVTVIKDLVSEVCRLEKLLGTIACRTFDGNVRDLCSEEQAEVRAFLARMEAA